MNKNKKMNGRYKLMCIYKLITDQSMNRLQWMNGNVYNEWVYSEWIRYI